MNGYNFTESVRKSLAIAREEAARLHHEYVGTEHMLLGIIGVNESTANVILEKLSIDYDEVRRKVEETVKKGPADVPTGPDLPYTSRAKKVLELSMTEARDLGHGFVGTEHLLLGLLREEKGIAAQVLAVAGLTLESARAELVRIFRDTGSQSARPRALEPTTFKLLAESPVARAAQFVHNRSFRFSLPLAFLGGVVVGWLLHLL